MTAADGAASESKPGRPAGGMLQNVRAATRLLVRADAKVFRTAVALQVLGALSATGFVYAGKLVIGALGTLGGPVDLGALVWPVILLSVTSALASSASVMQVQQSRLLGEAANRDIWTELLAVASRVDLETYERPSFYDRLDRVSNNAIRQPVQMAMGVLNLIGGFIGATALIVLLATIQPLLLIPLVIGAGPAL